MADLITLAQIERLGTIYSLGRVWDTATPVERSQAIDTAEALWHGLNWIESPFESAVLAAELQYPLALHARSILETQGAVPTVIPDEVLEVLKNYLRRSDAPFSLRGASAGRTSSGGTTTTSGGLNQGEVESLIKRNVSDWAESSNSDPIPADKLSNAPGGTEFGTEQGQVERWAEGGDSSRIPTNKLPDDLLDTTDLNKALTYVRSVAEDDEDLQAIITRQLVNKQSIIIEILADFSGRVLGVSETFTQGDIWFMHPESGVPIFWFNKGKTTAAIPDDSITTRKLADNAVTEDKIANDAVGASQLKANVITQGLLANSPIIDNTRLENNAVTSSKIAAETIEDGDIRGDTITEAKLNSAVRTKLNAGRTAGTDPERLIDTGASLATLFVDKTAAGVKSWKIDFVNPSAIPSTGYWYDTDVAGQPSAEGRRVWAGSSSITWTVSNANAESLSQVTDSSLDVNLYIYDEASGRTSNYVARKRFRAFFRGATEGGLNESQVDARIADWAETGNTDKIPAAKLPVASGDGTSFEDRLSYQTFGTLTPHFNNNGPVRVGYISEEGAAGDYGAMGIMEGHQTATIGGIVTFPDQLGWAAFDSVTNQILGTPFHQYSSYIFKPAIRNDLTDTSPNPLYVIVDDNVLRVEEPFNVAVSDSEHITYYRYSTNPAVGGALGVAGAGLRWRALATFAGVVAPPQHVQVIFEDGSSWIAADVVNATDTKARNEFKSISEYLLSEVDTSPFRLYGADGNPGGGSPGIIVIKDPNAFRGASSGVVWQNVVNAVQIERVNQDGTTEKYAAVAPWKFGTDRSGIFNLEFAPPPPPNPSGGTRTFRVGVSAFPESVGNPVFTYSLSEANPVWEYTMPYNSHLPDIPDPPEDWARTRNTDPIPEAKSVPRTEQTLTLTSSTKLDIDASEGSACTLNMNGFNCTGLSISNGYPGQTLTLKVVQTKTAGSTLSIDVSKVRNDAHGNPILSDGLNETDWLYFYNDGSNWFYAGFARYASDFNDAAKLVQTITPTSGNVIVEPGRGHSVNLNMNRNITSLSINTGPDGSALLIRAIQDTTGSRTLTLNGINGTVALTSTAKAVDLLLFYSYNGTWLFIGSKLNVS